ncbi:ROK family protein [Candidatus Oleimmundimicrobium sp.]|uniref:ROK family protein n=1 Tax=Candidatus Oleimmundimicrobium sp. TaxID=3060597 RepID=UPI0027209D5D|nr:ROK family protein [Candidatus Oleimmundimicrobium sp.]MDO8886317.1 ROK family protein [Candidatus Oleimmundimicrobium sp.]
MSDNGFVVGVDIGGTKTTVALLDERDGILCERVEPTSRADFDESQQGSQRILNQVISLINKVCDVSGIALSDVSGIGNGVAGTIDFKSGTVIFSPNLPFRNFGFKDAMYQHFKIPIFLDNDANVAVWGEKCFGAGRNASEIVGVTIGTGIGGGLIINDKIYRGAVGCAAEIGHMIIDRNGPRCGCGNYGCFEAMAAGSAIAKKARAVIAKKPDALILKMAGGNIDKVNGESLVLAAAEGDELALGVLREIGEIIGVAFTSLVNIFNPEVIIVGGGVAETGDLILNFAEDIVRNYAIKPNSEIVKIVKAELGNKAGFMGAASLIRKEIESYND